MDATPRNWKRREHRATWQVEGEWPHYPPKATEPLRLGRRHLCLWNGECLRLALHPGAPATPPCGEHDCGEALHMLHGRSLPESLHPHVPPRCPEKGAAPCIGAAGREPTCGNSADSRCA